MNRNDSESIVAFVQARVSSQRFPGKVLKPFLGKPVIAHILESIAQVNAIDRTVVLTSDQASDDSLVEFLQSQDCQVYRGPLEDVFERFRQAVRRYPSEWIMRFCADSPLLCPEVVKEVARHASESEDWDVVTTRFSPPFPKGQNAELIRTATLMDVDTSQLTAHDREHVTPWFYRNPHRYRIGNARAVAIDLPGEEFTIDTPEDLERLETLFRGRFGSVGDSR